MPKISFYGVKAFMSDKPVVGSDFWTETLSAKYYVEIGRVTEIPIRIVVELKNLSNRPMFDVMIRVMGLRRDYHQNLVGISSDRPMETKIDLSGNVDHVLRVDVIPPKKSLKVTFDYKVKTHPYDVSGCRAYCRREVVRGITNAYGPPGKEAGIIRQLAEKLRRRSVIQTIKTVVEWIRRNICYEKAYIRYSVSDTLNKGRGSCLSVSDLLVSILHVLGIPARVVRGFYTYRPHAWVEAIIGHDNRFFLVPIDVLAGMVGAIGSIWISQYAEIDRNRRSVEVDRKGLMVKYTVDIPH